MRAWDNWNSYLNNDRKLLHGKIRFCRKGTTDDVTIYNTDGIPLRNPIFTDALGRAEYQVFVDDDVTAYFYQYIGTGDMTAWPIPYAPPMSTEDYDPSRWSMQYTSDDIAPVNYLEIEANGASGTATMATLRDIDPDDVPQIDGVTMIWLYGYYAAGDTSPVLYVWDSASDELDDGGSVIMSNAVPGQGRWRLATRELHFDVRHFGIFPTNDIYSTNYAYTSQLANCAAYVDSCGLDAWFPALDDELSYYLFDGTNTFSIKNDIYISDAVRFHCKTDTSNTAILCHVIHKNTPYLFVSSVQTGAATLTADWINISWVGGMVTGNARIGWVIDSDSFARIIENKEVRFETNGSASLQLNNCVITSGKKITGEITIQNSILKTEFFADDYDWSDLTSVNNDIRLVNCKDANTYVLLKNKQFDPHYGDLGEQNLKNATLLPNAIVENATFENVTLTGNSELHNVSGSVVIQGSAYGLNIVDCWLSLTGQNIALDSLQWRRGFISSASQIQCLTACKMWDVEVNAPLYTNGAQAEFERCRINSAVTGQYVVCNNCNIDAVVTTSDVAGKVDFSFDGCTFGANGRHSVTATTADSQVTGAWVGNFAESAHPIDIDMTNIVNNDLSHTYVYEGNHGKFLPRYPRKSLIDLSVGWGYNTTPASQNSVADPSIMFSLDSTGDIFGGIGDIRGMLMRKLHVDIPFFAIGEAVAVYAVRVAIKADCKYGGYTDPTTFAFDGALEATVPDASLFNTNVFDSLLVGPPQPLPKNWLNDVDYPKRAYVTFERLV